MVAALEASLFNSLSSSELITPYLEMALRNDNWPDQLMIPLPEHGSKTDDYFHPSSHCELDARELYYRLHPEHRFNLLDRKFAAMDILSMMQGTIFHVIVQQKLKIEGWIEDDDIEVPLINEEHHGKGHLDLLFPNHPVAHKDIPVDIKTASPDSFSNMFRPRWSHLAQLNCYMDWLGYDEGVILVIEAGRPFRMKEFRVLRDELMLHSIYKKWAQVRQALEDDEIPSICKVKAGACSVGSPKYKKCPAHVMCAINDVKV